VPRLTFFDRRIRFLDLFVALLLAAAGCASVIATSRGFGHSWDEALYLKPSQEAMNWWRDVWRDPGLLSSQGIDQHWGERLDSADPLHPEIAPLPKLVLGAGLEWGSRLVGDPLFGMRSPVGVLFGLTVGIAYLFGALEFGALGGWAAALFYWLMPRAFGHAHVAASETILAFCTSLTCLLFVLSTRSGWLAPLAGIAFGLAIATKVTSLVLPIPLLIWAQIYRRRTYASSMFCLVFVGPAVAVALWPWLWHDGLRRFFAYLLFYAQHQSTAIYYMGQLWGYTHGPPAPWHYPWVITAVGWPEWLLLFAVLGALRGLVQLAHRPVLFLVLLLALLWIAISSLPGAPKYDGERLFFPSMFFLALLAAAGFSLIGGSPLSSKARRAWGYGALLIVAVWGAADLHFSHPNQLNYYNWIVGRPRGAYKRGFETSYWGEALNEECISCLNEAIKPGERVQVLAMNELCYEDLQHWGKLRGDISFAASQPPFDWIVLQVRQGFLGSYERQIRQTLKPVKTFGAQGVPKLEIYQAPDDMKRAQAVMDQLTSASAIPAKSWRLPGADASTSSAATATSETLQTSSTQGAGQ
jgi:4-amino-4-deoxy-L-arabinose transferase-like glycosyltransferase